MESRCRNDTEVRNLANAVSREWCEGNREKTREVKQGFTQERSRNEQRKGNIAYCPANGVITQPVSNDETGRSANDRP